MKRICLLACFLSFWIDAAAQTDTLTLSLEGVISMAQGESPNSQIAETRLSNNYWIYQSFLGNYKPQIDLSATFPDLNRAINAITQPDGSILYIPQSFMRNELDIALRQDIALTGGTLFFRTGLRRIDIFSTKTRDYELSYLSSPVSLDFIQPLFAFNQLRWDKIIQPLRFDEAKRQYSEDLEEVAYQSAELFFNVLIAQLNLQAAIRDKTNADTLLGISQGRFDVGRIAETELLQIELNAMNSNADLAAQTLNLQTSTERLRDFLGIQRAVYFKLIPPDEIPDFYVDAVKALDFAVKNRSETIQFNRRLAEADRSVAQAKADRSPDINLTGSFGLSQTGNNFGDAFNDLLDQERLRVGMQIPIADWGKAKSRMEIAQSNSELTRMIVAQDRINFERDIVVKVQQFELVRNQVILALRAYEVAQKRLTITRQRYRIGKLLVTDLNIAITEEANARRAYISALRSFWLAHYDIRRLTLYDFLNDVSLKRNVYD
jgi:outer membrane protein TolC